MKQRAKWVTVICLGAILGGLRYFIGFGGRSAFFLGAVIPFSAIIAVGLTHTNSKKPIRYGDLMGKVGNILGNYDLQFILFFLVLPATLILVASFLLRLSAKKSRALAKALGGSDEPKARQNLRKHGLIVMAVPWAIMLSFNIIFVIASVPIGGMLLIMIIPFLAVFLITLSHSLLGSSLAIGVFVLLAIPSIGLIALHYEISAWYGGLILLFDIVWLIGALTVIKSLPRRPKNLQSTNIQEAIK